MSAGGIKQLLENIQSAAEAVGKALWVFIALFVAAAVGTGNPALLGAIRDRLILAGITSLKTPFGEIDPKQIGQLATGSRILEINAARASELAAGASDVDTRKQLESIASDLKVQQQVQVEALSSAVATQVAVTTAAAAAASDTEGWVYVGRRSEGEWRPSSFSIDRPVYPVKPGNQLVVKTNALLYDSVDCKTLDVSDFKASPSTKPTSVVFVKPGPVGLQVSAIPVECPSIGKATTVWAKIKVPAARLIRIAQ